MADAVVRFPCLRCGASMLVDASTERPALPRRPVLVELALRCPACGAERRSVVRKNPALPEARPAPAADAAQPQPLARPQPAPEPQPVTA